jgi:hypothetical protein
MYLSESERERERVQESIFDGKAERRGWYERGNSSGGSVGGVFKGKLGKLHYEQVFLAK